MPSAQKLTAASCSTDPKNNYNEYFSSYFQIKKHTLKLYFFSKAVAPLAAVAFATTLLTGPLARAQDEPTPDFAGVTKLEAPVISPRASERELRARAASMSGRQTLGALPSALPAAAASAEVAELARGLRYDPDLIYEFVYNNVTYTPVFGYRKGPTGTLIDREGNSFDQAALMVALLRESGYTANFVFGQIRLDAAQLQNWLGVDNNVTAVSNLLGFSGTPAVVTPGGGGVAHVDKAHVWVKVNIDGADYVFDPAFKTHTWSSGIDLGTVLGYDQTTFVNGALAGSVFDEAPIPGPIPVILRALKGLNESNISSNLDTYATNLADHIRNNMPAAGVKDIVGGSTIDTLAPGTAQRLSSLPYQQSVTAEWTEIPDQYKPTLRIEYQGIDQTFFADDIYGRRLTLFFNASNQPVLRLAGSDVATGTAIAPNQVSTAIFRVDNPYAALGGTFGDQAATGTIVTGGSYNIANSFGDPGRGMVETHRRLLGEARLTDGADDSEPILGQALAVMGYNWLAQNAVAQDISDQIRGVTTIHHHSVGLTGQTTGPYTDVRINGFSFVDLSASAGETSAFFNTAGIASAKEAGMLQQIHQGPAGATVSMFDIANKQGYSFLEVDGANWIITKALLQGLGYPVSLLNEIEPFILGGGRAYAPSTTVGSGGTGAVTVGNWTGHALLLVAPGESGIAHVVASAKGGHLGADVSPRQVGDNALTNSLTIPVTDTYSQHAAFVGDPVDVFGGKFTHERDDISIGSAEFPFRLTFHRSYDSDARFQEDGPLGRGWTHNFNVQAILDSDSFQGLGEDSAIDAASAITGLFVSLDVFGEPKTLQIMTVGTLVQDWYMDQLVENSVIITHPGNEQQFIKLADGSFNPPPGEAHTLVEEPDGSYLYTTKHGVDLDFDADGKLTTWQDPNGVTVTLGYDIDGKLQTIDNGLGRTLTFNYSGDQISNVADGNGRSVSYGYDTDGNLTTFTDAEANPTTYTYSAGPGLLAEVFAPSFPTTAVISNTFDAFGRVKEQRTARNFLWQYFYGGLRTEAVDPLGNSEVWEFNEFGRITRHVDQLGNTTVNEYDGLQRLVRTTLPEGNAMAYDYDANHNMETVTATPKPGSPLPQIMQSFVYDQTWNKPIQATDPLGNTTDFILDPTSGNLERIEAQEVNAIRPTTNYAYDSNGQVLTVTDPEGKVTRFAYDPATADLLSVTEDDGGLNLTSVFVYDTIGNVTSIRDPNGRIATSLHDKERRLVEATQPAPFGHVSKTQYDEDGRVRKVERETGDPVTPWQVTSFLYDAAGNRISATVPGNHTSTYEHDELDRLRKVTDAEGRSTETIYDPMGRVARVLETVDLALGTTQDRVAYTYTPNGKQETLTDSEGNLTRYNYDGFDRLERTTYPDESFEEVTYDANGNTKTQHTRSGQVFAYDYDVLNRLKREDVPYSTTDIVYTYDLIGRPLTITDEAGTIIHSYDTSGRLETVTRPDTKTVTYDYDANGNRTQLTWPDNWFVTYSYDELNRITNIKENGTEVLAQYEYDALSRRTLITYGNGTTSSLDFDPDDNDLNAIDHTFGSSSVSFSYTYNQNDERNGEVVTDDLYLWRPDGSANQSYTPNNLNQYSTVGGTTFAYDDNGNLVDDGYNTYTFDAKNRLIQAVNPQHTSTYAYDPLDRRVAKTVDALTTKFLLDGAMEIAEYDGATDALLLRHVYGPGMTAPLVEISAAGSTRFLHTDAVGSVVAVSGGSSSGGGVVDPEILAQATATPQGSGNLTIPSFEVSAGDNRVLLVALAAEYTTISGVTFGGVVMTQVGQVVNDRNTVAFYELREMALSPGAHSGDLVVNLNNTTGGGVQVMAWTLTGIDQSASAVLSEAFNGGTSETTISASVTTSASSSILVSAFSLGDPITWAPGFGETQAGYAISSSTAGGASTEVVAAGNHDMSWSGPAARRPTLMLAAYTASGSTPPDVLGAQTTPWEGEGDVSFAGYTVPAGEDRALLVAVSNEDGTINGVTFGGQALSPVGLVTNSLNDVALYELREAAIGTGPQTGDIIVQMSGVSNDGRSTQAVAIAVAGVDQTATPTVSQALNPGTAETSISASVSTSASKSMLISVFGLGDQVTWTPGAGQVQAGYAASGTAAGGASTEIVAPGVHNMSWSGSAARRPTLLVAAYTAAASGGVSAGNVVERYAYGPHGEGLDDGLGNISFRYAGHHYDRETKLVYMRARYYSVAIGRFLSPDPIGYADGFNLYTYGANSPLNFIDPTGLAGIFVGPEFERARLRKRDRKIIATIEAGLRQHRTKRDTDTTPLALASIIEAYSHQEPELQPGDRGLIMRTGEALRGEGIRELIDQYGDEIDAAATTLGVDVGLIQGIIYEEQSHLLPGVESDFAEQQGYGATVGLGQVTVGLHGYTREQLLDPATNIRAIATHLAYLKLRPLINSRAPISSLATSYNCGTCKSITSYGRRVNFYRSQLYSQ